LKIVSIASKMCYFAFSLSSLNLIEGFLKEIRHSQAIGVVVPTAATQLYLLSLVGIVTIAFSYLMLLIISAKHRWAFVLSVTVGVSTSVLLAWLTQVGLLMILAIYLIPQFPLLFAKSTRASEADSE
jgi:hypothetical protein